MNQNNAFVTRVLYSKCKELLYSKMRSLVTQEYLITTIFLKSRQRLLICTHTTMILSNILVLKWIMILYTRNKSKYIPSFPVERGTVPQGYTTVRPVPGQVHMGLNCDTPLDWEVDHCLWELLPFSHKCLQDWYQDGVYWHFWRIISTCTWRTVYNIQINVWPMR